MGAYPTGTGALQVKTTFHENPQLGKLSPVRISMRCWNLASLALFCQIGLACGGPSCRCS